jgi:hypothetical protein
MKPLLSTPRSSDRAGWYPAKILAGILVAGLLTLMSACGGKSAVVDCSSGSTCVGIVTQSCAPICSPDGGADGGTGCPSGTTCQTTSACCSGAGCSAASASVCLPPP